LSFQFQNHFSIAGLIKSQPTEINLEFPGDPMQGSKRKPACKWRYPMAQQTLEGGREGA
jgi:hypothetical protein